MAQADSPPEANPALESAPDLADIEAPPRRRCCLDLQGTGPVSASPPRLPDRQGWSTLIAGALLLLISFITNYGDDNLVHFVSIPTHEQVGRCLHVAALAALVGDVQLATRLRHRAANESLRKQTEHLKKENARLAAIESRLARFEQEHFSGSNPLSSTGDSWPS